MLPELLNEIVRNVRHLLTTRPGITRQQVFDIEMEAVGGTLHPRDVRELRYLLQAVPAGPDGDPSAGITDETLDDEE